MPDAPVSLTNDPTVTTDTQIRFTWSDGASDGGNAVIDYAVYYDQGTDSFVLLDGGVTDQFYLTTVTLTAGTTYKFKVTARNEVGISVESEVVEILAAKLPDAPINLVNMPEITNAYQVGLLWDIGAYNGGSPVIDYQVSFTEVTANSYQVFSTGLTATYEIVTGLTPGVTYRFVVQARNVVSLSVYSNSVDVLAAQVPDAPTDLSNNPAITNADQIGLTWAAPVFTGGSPLIDYRLYTDNASGTDFTILVESLTVLEYTATGLTQGATYKFKVEVRNLYGYSEFSEPVTILAAQVPATPDSPVTTWAPDDVVVSWVAPDAGGSPITGYII